jgi:hypothetical protein
LAEAVQAYEEALAATLATYQTALDDARRWRTPQARNAARRQAHRAAQQALWQAYTTVVRRWVAVLVGWVSAPGRS